MIALPAIKSGGLLSCSEFEHARLSAESTSDASASHVFCTTYIHILVAAIMIDTILCCIQHEVDFLSAGHYQKMCASLSL